MAQSLNDFFYRCPEADYFLMFAPSELFDRLKDFRTKRFSFSSQCVLHQKLLRDLLDAGLWKLTIEKGEEKK